VIAVVEPRQAGRHDVAEADAGGIPSVCPGPAHLLPRAHATRDMAGGGQEPASCAACAAIALRSPKAQ
jgi:hypothetical protein